MTPLGGLPEGLRQIGIGADGAPLFGYRDTTQVVQAAAPRPAARPIGAYVALGVGGAVALTFLAMAAAVLAIAVSIGAVSLTICTLVLRQVWRDYLANREG